MIKVDRGDIYIEGNGMEILADMAFALYRIKRLLIDDMEYPEDEANGIIQSCASCAQEYNGNKTTEKAKGENHDALNFFDFWGM